MTEARFDKLVRASLPDRLVLLRTPREALKFIQLRSADERLHWRILESLLLRAVGTGDSITVTASRAIIGAVEPPCLPQRLDKHA